MRRKGSICTSVALASLLWGAACGDGDAPLDGQCAEAPAPGRVPLPPPVDRTGFVTVQDTWDRTVDDTGVVRDLRTGRVQAGFADRSTSTSTPAQVMPLGEVCFGVLSRPVGGGSATPLSVSEVYVEGTARGTIRASRAGPSTFVAVGEPLLGEGGAELTVVVTSTSADGFPSVQGTLTSLRSRPELSSPDPLAPASLLNEPYPVRWTPSGADVVEITVTPGDDAVDDGGQVVCRVADTGCFDLPVAATAFLLAGNATQYTFSVSQQRFAEESPDAEHLLSLEVASETRLTLGNGVFE